MSLFFFFFFFEPLNMEYFICDPWFFSCFVLVFLRQFQFHPINVVCLLENTDMYNKLLMYHLITCLKSFTTQKKKKTAFWFHNTQSNRNKKMLTNTFKVLVNNNWSQKIWKNRIYRIWKWNLASRLHTFFLLKSTGYLNLTNFHDSFFFF